MNLIGSMKIQEEYICLVNLTGFDFGMIREGTICHVMFITSSYIKVSFNGIQANISPFDFIDLFTPRVKSDDISLRLFKLSESIERTRKCIKIA